MLNISTNTSADTRTNIIRTSLLLIGAALCFAGVRRGDMTVIMRKAVVICLECMGIG